jgi:hypothetical protein
MMSSSPPDSRRLRTVAWVFMLAAVAADCDQPLAVSGVAHGQSASQSTHKLLEFDLPDEYSSKDADGEFVVTGFRLGFFRPGEAVPISTREIGRDLVVVNGRRGQVLLSDDVGNVVLRLQTLTRNGASDWSAPSPAETVMSPAPDRSAGKTGRGRSGVSMSEVERHPRLAEALHKLLSPTKPEQVLASFRNINELARAVAICTEHGITLQKLGDTMVGPPRRSLRNAVTELKPALQGSDTMRKANAAAKQLLAAAP